MILSAKDQNQIYVPAGFAHGYLALSEKVQVLYKCSDFYHPADEHGVLWNDPALNTSWRIDAPVLSEKDSRYPRLADVPRDFLPRYSSK